MQDPVNTGHGADNQLNLCVGTATVTLSLKGSVTLDTCELEALVASLAMVRAGMAPGIPHDPPLASATEFIVNPRHAVIADPLSDIIFIFIRHPVFGWIALAQSEQEAIHLVLAMAGQLKLLDTEVKPDWSH